MRSPCRAVLGRVAHANTTALRLNRSHEPSGCIYAVRKPGQKVFLDITESRHLGGARIGVNAVGCFRHPQHEKLLQGAKLLADRSRTTINMQGQTVRQVLVRLARGYGQVRLELYELIIELSISQGRPGVDQRCCVRRLHFFHLQGQHAARMLQVLSSGSLVLAHACQYHLRQLVRNISSEVRTIHCRLLSPGV